MMPPLMKKVSGGICPPVFSPLKPRFWMKDKFMMKKGIPLFVAACLLFLYSCRSGRSQQFTCHPIEVEGGYGYVVLRGADTLIRQPFMPAIGGRRPFYSRETALRTGQKVCAKLEKGLPPTLSKEEVLEETSTR